MKFYAYFISEDEKGIVKNWQECERKVKGMPGARYRSFSSEEEAEQWVKGGARYEEKGYRASTLKKGVYFDAGTGRGMGLIEIKVTDEKGASLLSKVFSPSHITRFGTYVITRRSATNNYGELLALFYALKIAMKEGEKNIYGDSRLVIDFWSKGTIREHMMSHAAVARAAKVTVLRRQFEEIGGGVHYISGDENPADLGFHR